MRELKFSKPSQVGEVKVNIRIIGNKIYFKYNQNPYMDQMMKQLEAKGVKFRKSRLWLEVDIFGDNKVVNLGDYQIDLDEDSNEQVENKLTEFYTIQYIKAGFSMDDK